jgi:hypothetical protein
VNTTLVGIALRNALCARPAHSMAECARSRHLPTESSVPLGAML